jgi:hypothetical protein
MHPVYLASQTQNFLNSYIYPKRKWFLYSPISHITHYKCYILLIEKQALCITNESIKIIQYRSRS